MLPFRPSDLDPTSLVCLLFRPHPQPSAVQTTFLFWSLASFPVQFPASRSSQSSVYLCDVASERDSSQRRQIVTEMKTALCRLRLRLRETLVAKRWTLLRRLWARTRSLTGASLGRLHQIISDRLCNNNNSKQVCLKTIDVPGLWGVGKAANMGASYLFFYNLCLWRVFSGFRMPCLVFYSNSCTRQTRSTGGVPEG